MKIRDGLLRSSFLIGFALAGLASASLLVWARGALLGGGNLSGFSRLLWNVLVRFNFLGSLTFGLFLAVCLWVFSGLRSTGKTVLFICASPAAAVLSIWVAVFMDGKFGIEPRSGRPEDLRLYFIGGYVGAFLLTLLAPWVLAQQMSFLRRIVQSLCWAIGGGALAVAGILGGSQFRDLCLRLNPSDPAYETSLLLIWQTGVAFLLGLQLWVQERKGLMAPLEDQ